MSFCRDMGTILLEGLGVVTVRRSSCDDMAVGVPRGSFTFPFSLLLFSSVRDINQEDQ